MEEGIIKPLEVSSHKAKGKSYKEVTDAQEAIMASIKEANATRGKQSHSVTSKSGSPLPLGMGW
jgi:hypothetical protein